MPNYIDEIKYFDAHVKNTLEKAEIKASKTYTSMPKDMTGDKKGYRATVVFAVDRVCDGYTPKNYVDETVQLLVERSTVFSITNILKHLKECVTNWASKVGIDNVKHLSPEKEIAAVECFKKYYDSIQFGHYNKHMSAKGNKDDSKGINITTHCFLRRTGEVYLAMAVDIIHKDTKDIVILEHSVF